MEHQTNYVVTSYITSRKPHTQRIAIVKCLCGCEETHYLCPECDAQIKNLGDRHGRPERWTAEIAETVKQRWNACPWPHPKPASDGSGGYLMADFGGIVVVMQTTPEYPAEHPYWTWINAEKRFVEPYMCTGPKISDPCRPPLSGHIGIALHSRCDEECSCHCHWEICTCPDPDKPVASHISAIECGIHGHQYSRLTTKGLIF